MTELKTTKRFISLLTAFSIILLSSALNFAHAAETHTALCVDESFTDNAVNGTPVLEEGMGSIEVSGEKLLIGTESYGSPTRAVWSFDSISGGVFSAQATVTELGGESFGYGNTLFALGCNTAAVVSVVTEEQKLMLDYNGAKTEITTYASDTPIALKMEFDFNDKSFDVYVDGTKYISDAPFDSSFDFVMFEVNKAPGITVDDISVTNTIPTLPLEIGGADKSFIPVNGENEYIYSAIYKDAGGNIINYSEFEWSLASAYEGVTLSQNGASATLKISPSAAEGSVVIKASPRGNAAVVASKTVSLLPASGYEVKVVGSRHVTNSQKSGVNYHYTATMYDSDGNEMTDETFIWSIQGSSTADLNINEDGWLTVGGQSPAEDEHIAVRATLARDTDVFGERKVVVQDYETYNDDAARVAAVKDSIDYILENGSDKNGNHPLISTYLSPYSGEQGTVWFELDKDPVALTDISQNFQLHRAMVGLSGLSDDSTYSDRVDAIYKHYLEYGFSGDGLLLGGNHQHFDMKTGRIADYWTHVSARYMELEDRDLYSEKFNKIWGNDYHEFIKNFWTTAIVDWNTLAFNRHTVIDDKYASTSVLENLSAYDDTAQDVKDASADPGRRFMDKFIAFNGLTFMSAGNVMIRTAADAYIYYGDEYMKQWGYNMIKRYLNTTHDETGIMGVMYVTSQTLPNIGSLEKDFGERYWESQAGWEACRGYGTYGDRIYNQFAQQTIDEGRLRHDGTPMSDEYRYECLEGSLMMSDRQFLNFPYEALDYAKNVMGLDTAEGKEIVTKITTSIANLIKLSYNPETNKFKTMFTNGVDVSDMKLVRGGYLGRANTEMGEYQISAACLATFMNLYNTAAYYPELNDKRQEVWDFVKKWTNIRFNIGDLGDPIQGIDPELNLKTKASDLDLLRMLIELYKSTRNYDYLTLARRVGDNLVKSQYKFTMFTTNDKLRYVCTEADAQLLLLMLEQAILDETDLVPESAYKNQFEVQTNFYKHRTGEYALWQSPDVLTWEYNNVLVTDVVLNSEDITLKSGEKVKLDFEIKPDDASSKGVYWEIGDRSIVSVNDSNEVIGLARGETTIYAVSKSTLGKQSKPIKIIVE